MAKFIAVASGKGGTGKTTVSVNLALALSMAGKDVIVVDSNMNTPHIGLHLGFPLLEITLHDVLEGKKKITEATYLHHSGIKIIPSSVSVNKKADAGKLISALSGLSALKSTVIMDTAPGLGIDALAPIKASDETIIVTTPDLLSVTDSLKTIKIAEELGSTVIGVVLNKTKKDSLEMSIPEIEEILEKTVLGEIPEDNYVRKALKNKNPLLYLYPKSKAALAFKKLALKLM